MKLSNQQHISPESLFEELTQTRIHDPERIVELALKRKRRKQFTPDGRLNILAADHPARRVTKAGSDPFAMADREDFLLRIIRILSADAADGIMATMDVLEELLLLDGLMQSRGMPGCLDEKLCWSALIEEASTGFAGK